MSNWSDQDLEWAIALYKEDGLSIRAASKESGIPYSTLRNRITQAQQSIPEGDNRLYLRIEELTKVVEGLKTGMEEHWKLINGSMEAIHKLRKRIEK